MFEALVDVTHVEARHRPLHIKDIDQIQLQMCVEVGNKPPEGLAFFLLIEEVVVEDLVHFVIDHGRPGVAFVGYELLVTCVVESHV